MNILLDTHILFWWLTDAPRLPDKVRTLIVNRSQLVYVSAATIWETAIKFKLGKWPEVAPFLDDFANILATEAFEPLPITLAHAHLAGQLDWSHKDPFDRMLLAQTLLEDLTFILVDKVFETAPFNHGKQLFR